MSSKESSVMKRRMMICGEGTWVLSINFLLMRHGSWLECLVCKMFMGKKYLVFAGYTKIRLHGRDCNEGKVIYHGSGFLLESRCWHYLCAMQKCSRNKESLFFSAISHLRFGNFSQKGSCSVHSPPVGMKLLGWSLTSLWRRRSGSVFVMHFKLPCESMQ